MRVTSRDIVFLLWLNGWGAAVLTQIARWFDVDISTAARRMRILEKNGLICRRGAFGASKIIAVTEKGRQLAGDKLPPLAGFRTAELRHDLAMIDIERGTNAQFPGSSLEPARRIKHRRNGTEMSKQLPDAILHRPDCPDTAIELELSLKSHRRIAKIMSNYAADLSINEVWYLTDNMRVAETIRRAAKDFPHIRVVPFSYIKRAKPPKGDVQ